MRGKGEQHRIRRTKFDNERKIAFRKTTYEDKPKNPSVMLQNEKLWGAQMHQCMYVLGKIRFFTCYFILI